MKKNYSILAALLISASLTPVFANDAPKTVNIQKLPDGTTITIDGIANEGVWSSAAKHADFVLYPAEKAQDEGAKDMAGYWQAIWAPTGMYVLVAVTADDILSDGKTGADWEQDGIEIYFDMNTDKLADGGGKGAAENAAGHYDFYAKRDLTTTDHAALISYMGIGEGSDAALVMTGNTSVIETFVSWANIKDKDGNVYTPSASKKIGFDICLVDNDNKADQKSPRTRQFWSSNAETEPWAKADSIATATLVAETVGTAVPNMFSKEDINVYSSMNVLHISKSIQGKLLNMVGQEVLSINGNSANVSGLKTGAYILVTNDNKFHKKLIIK